MKDKGNAGDLKEKKGDGEEQTEGKQRNREMGKGKEKGVGEGWGIGGTVEEEGSGRGGK